MTFYLQDEVKVGLQLSKRNTEFILALFIIVLFSIQNVNLLFAPLYISIYITYALIIYLLYVSIYLYITTHTHILWYILPAPLMWLLYLHYYIYNHLRPLWLALYNFCGVTLYGLCTERGHGICCITNKCKRRWKLAQQQNQLTKNVFKRCFLLNSLNIITNWAALCLLCN